MTPLMRVDHEDRSAAGRLPDACRTSWIRGFTASERGGFNWWLQRFPDVEVVVGVVLRGRPEMPRVVRERFWDLVRSGVAPGDAGVAAGSADGARRWFRVAGGGTGGGRGGGGSRWGWGGGRRTGGWRGGWGGRPRR